MVGTAPGRWDSETHGTGHNTFLRLTRRRRHAGTVAAQVRLGTEMEVEIKAGCWFFHPRATEGSGTEGSGAIWVTAHDKSAHPRGVRH